MEWADEFTAALEKLRLENPDTISELDIFGTESDNTFPIRIGWFVYDHERMNHLFATYPDWFHGSRFLILQSHLLVYPDVHAVLPKNISLDGVIQDYYSETDLATGRCRIYTYNKLNCIALSKVMRAMKSIRPLKTTDFPGYTFAIPRNVFGPILKDNIVDWRYEGPVVPYLNAALRQWPTGSTTVSTVQALADIPTNMDMGDFLYVFVVNDNELRLLYKRFGVWNLNAPFSVPHQLDGVGYPKEYLPRNSLNAVYEYATLTYDYQTGTKPTIQEENMARAKKVWEILHINYYV